jgi:hypothetical protein
MISEECVVASVESVLTTTNNIQSPKETFFRKVTVIAASGNQNIGDAFRLFPPSEQY